MATLLALIFAAGATLILRDVEMAARARAGEQLLHTTKALSLSVASDLETYEGMLLGLRQSEALQRRDWTAFDSQARQLLSGDGEAWIVVGDRAGQQLVNTRLPPASKLPGGRSPSHIWPVLDRARGRVCDLSEGLVSNRIVCLDTPVMEGNRAAYHLSVVFRPEALQRRLLQQDLPASHTATILDSRGVIIWRTRSPDQFVGRSPRATLLAQMSGRPQGVVHDVTLEGVPSLFAFSRTPGYPWSVMVSVPEREVRTGGRNRLPSTVLVLLVCSALTALVVGFAGRRVATAVGRLAGAADRIREGRRLEMPVSGLREIDAVAELLDQALADREQSEERFNLAQDVGGIGWWDWDIVADAGHVSLSFKRMHGLEHIEGPLRFSDVASVVHPEDRSGYLQRLSAAMKRGEPSTNEYRAVLPDGSVRWIVAKGRPTQHLAGEPISALGVVIDLTDRKHAEDQLRLLMREVDHRANNLMAVVEGTVRLSRASPGEDLREIILGRVAALARAHHLLANSRWEGADLRRLVTEEMLPYTYGDPDKVVVDGKPVPLAPAAAQGMAMALHELATNAAKHGSLSSPSGQVRIRWRVSGGVLRLWWAESGGPAVAPPARKGFGTTVLQRALGGAIRGRSLLTWARDGLTCELELPYETALTPGRDTAAAEA